MRQPFFSIANTAIYVLLAGMFASLGTSSTNVLLGTYEFTPSVLWALSGLMFLMAYFSLVHLKSR